MLQKYIKISGNPMVRYLSYSILVTIIDTAIVWVLYHTLNVNLVASNSIGVITGFLIHYALSSKSVFQAEFGIPGFLVYLATFLFGLVIADGLIYIGEHYLFIAQPDHLSFLLSKGLSIVIPFFLLYYLRKLLFDLIKRIKLSEH